MRALTRAEKDVLAYVVADPDGWWTHCQTGYKGNPELALAAKLARWKPHYDTAIAEPEYKTRAVREALKPRS